MRRWIHENILLKYFIIGIALALSGSWLGSIDSKAFTPAMFGAGLFYSTLTSLIVTLIYDLIIRAELQALSRADVAEHQSKLLGNLAGSLHLDKLTEELHEAFAKRVVESQQTMQLVAKHLAGSSDDGDEFYRGWINPLLSGEALRDVYVTNTLVSCTDPRCYNIQFQQSFRKGSGFSSYIVVFTCDNNVYENFITSSINVGEMVGTSPSEWYDIDKQVESLTMIAIGGQLRTNRVLERQRLSKQDLGKLINHDDFLESTVRAFEFFLEEDSRVQYKFSYNVRNRLSDPFYVWTAVRPTFMKELTINYSDLRSNMRVGPVTANSIVNRTRSFPNHNLTQGIYSVTIDSLLWPGQGAFIVWRPQPGSFDGDHCANRSSLPANAQPRPRVESEDVQPQSSSIPGMGQPGLTS